MAVRLLRVRARVPFGLSIISGWRSDEQQRGLDSLPPCSEGRPCSTHTVLPATGADVWPSVVATNDVKAALGVAATLEGLRWGGGSPVDPSTGIPVDWNHLDLGPVA